MGSRFKFMQLGEGDDIQVTSHKGKGDGKNEMVLKPITRCFILWPLCYKFWKIQKLTDVLV